MKLHLLLLLILLAGCSTGTPIPIATASVEAIQAEEIAVYAALLDGLYPGKSIVLMDQTVVDNNLEDAVQQMTGVDPGTTASYRQRNASAHTLDADMQLGLEYSLLSQEDMRALFNINQDGWSMFYDRHPDAAGITSISRAGFNERMDQALVYIGTQSHWVAGAGYYVLLIKVEGTWTIDQQIMIWIS